MTHSGIVRTLVTLVTSACMSGPGSGLVGVSKGNDQTPSGGARVLSFFAEPGNASVGQVMPLVQVAASDSLGAVDTTFTGVIRLTLASNAAGGGLHGGTAVRASDGIATFTTLSIDKAGTYTIRASATGATAVVSGVFTITTATTP